MLLMCVQVEVVVSVVDVFRWRSLSVLLMCVQVEVVVSVVDVCSGGGRCQCC